jgi:cysteine desulfurase
MDRIYLDHNATTPLEPRVLEAMLPVLKQGFGNPSSLHSFGQEARGWIDEARREVARLLGATPAEIVITGSGTEADNLALRGFAGKATAPRTKIVYGAIEHHAVMNTARALAEDGFVVESVRASREGVLDLEDLERKVDEGTALVAVMLANNETGVIQPLKEVVRIARSKGAFVHCDAVQAVGKIPVDVKDLDVDTLALSAHKFSGPKGVGALYVRRGINLRPLVWGGAQERNRRGGTENVAGIVGLGRAAAIARGETAEEGDRLTPLRAALEAELLKIPGAKRNGDGPRVPNTTNVSFEGVEAETLVLALDLEGIAVSTGAACAAGAIEPSHVLRAMHLSPSRVQGSLRYSVGRGNTLAQIHVAATATQLAIERQRRLATARA